MRDWILFIFAINIKLDKLCAILDKRIERRALNLILPTARIIDDIYKLNDFKMRLINLRVLHNYIAKNLTASELSDVRNAAGIRDDNENTQGCCRSTLYRRRIRALDKCARLALFLGYTSERLDREYPSYAEIARRVF